MYITKSEIASYLADVFKAVKAGKYQISQRKKNLDMYLDYVFTEEDAKAVIFSLTPEDFSEAVHNDHPQFAEEILYIFGKDVMLLPKYGGGEKKVPLYIKFNKIGNRFLFIISLHKQECPLTYQFR